MEVNLCASLARNGKTYASAYPSEQRLMSMGAMEAGRAIREGECVALRSAFVFVDRVGKCRYRGLARRRDFTSGAGVAWFSTATADFLQRLPVPE
jgi:hypothetical protein